MDRIQERLGPIYEVMKSAARSEAEVAEVYKGAQTSRFTNLSALAVRLAERGPLRSGLTVEEAARTIWVLASPEARQILLEHAGSSRERYSTWLSETLSAALLPPARCRTTRGPKREQP